MFEFAILIAIIWYVHSRGEKKGFDRGVVSARNARIDEILGTLDSLENVDDLKEARARLHSERSKS